MASKYNEIGKKYAEHVSKAMREIAQSMIRYMESDVRIPIDTHNLKDGIGIAIYKEGMLDRFYMSPKAVEPRNVGSIGGQGYGTVWGKNAIADLMSLGSTKYNMGYNMVLFSAMPYDEIQDASGINAGWFSHNLISEFEQLVSEVTLKFGGIEYDVII